ncbi:ABC-2 type transport system permease protein [Sinobacterium caligoides]|uniref:Transport permease protein n=1 Tax=Sinobacterium caligoides TaxID=933926 RepID=A0A3N2DZ24_9GAMM|nr:ABC transporter permease [Sinobacterium caligoides]ROS05017.1 ABC-2 type transport system permease protein [Sinobacterium caligoides]
MDFHGNLIALQTILGKEIRRFTRIWIQTLVPPAITVMLYFVIFGHLIGSRIGQMGGYSYMQFVVPGLIMMGVITNSYSNVVSSFFSAKFHHSIEELLVSPVSNHVILAGYILGGVTRGLLVGLIVTVLTLFFADVSIHNVWVTVSIVLLTSMLFSLMGFVNAVYANSFDDISIIPTFVLTPLIYLGGVFYSIDLLPDFWASLSQLNPILYMVNAFRYGVLGYSDINIVYAFVIVGIFNVALWFFCLHLLSSGKRLRQ